MKSFVKDCPLSWANQVHCGERFISLSLISCYKEQWQNYGPNTITMSNILYHIEKPQKRFTQKLELSHFYRIESLRDRLSHNYAKVKERAIHSVTIHEQRSTLIFLF